jgi:hypothetical protein
MQTKWDFAGSTDMWSTSAGGHLMKVVNLTGFTVHKRRIFGRARQLLFNIITKGYNVSALVSHHQACINPNHKD